MLKFFWKGVQSGVRSHDPLDHPAIRAMSLDEIADLPMTPDWPHGESRTYSAPARDKRRLCGS
ncbi:MAG: hypothetical protein IBJ07_09255 [Rhizobiaceae bacterium]|nr:hypothetical protein [Rhizobiaceae bacterium]